jgi:hypothetical protein
MYAYILCRESGRVWRGDDRLPGRTLPPLRRGTTRTGGCSGYCSCRVVSGILADPAFHMGAVMSSPAPRICRSRRWGRDFERTRYARRSRRPSGSSVGRRSGRHDARKSRMVSCCCSASSSGDSRNWNSCAVHSRDWALEYVRRDRYRNGCLRYDKRWSRLAQRMARVRRACPDLAPATERIFSVDPSTR